MAGVEPKVAINNDVTIDLAGLFGKAEAREQPAEKQQAKPLFLQAQKGEEDHKRTLEVYRTYQENIKRSDQLQTDILKGLKAGEDVYSLFLKAAKAISLMTSNSLFYSQTEADIKNIYGVGLNQKPPLQIELQETKERLQRLTEAEQRETDYRSRECIKSAIKGHKTRIETLEAMIGKETPL